MNVSVVSDSRTSYRIIEESVEDVVGMKAVGMGYCIAMILSQDSFNSAVATQGFREQTHDADKRRITMG